MPIRTRRLTRDYEKILADLAASDIVKVTVLAGDPPYHYNVSYQLNGLAWDQLNSKTYPISEHVVDIHLPLGYPKQQPRCVMRTPVWHPNIGDYVCIGDYWSPGVALVDIIAHIGDMIQYKTYNLKSPLNKEAAEWAQYHMSSFPVGTRDVIPPASESPQEEITISLPTSRDVLEITLGPMRNTQR